MTSQSATMAFPTSFTSGWDPFWKGLGLEEEDSWVEDEAFATSSFGTQDNSVKKRVSFANPVLQDQDELEKKKQRWRWRRTRKQKRKTRKLQQRKQGDDSFSDENSDSFDSFEAKAIEHRDEHLDDDLWDESDAREEEKETQGNGEPHEGQGIWRYFVFGGEERDFVFGGTEGYDESTIFSEETEMTLHSSTSEEDQRKNSITESLKSDDDVEGIEVVDLHAKAAKNSEKAPTTKSSKDQRDNSPPSNDSCISAASVEHESATMYSRSLIPVNIALTNTVADNDMNAVLRVDKQEPAATGASEQQTSNISVATSVPTEAVRNTVRSTEKKKKHGWRRVGRGKGEKNRLSKYAVRTSTIGSQFPTNQTLDSISNETGVQPKPPPTTGYGVDKGKSESTEKHNIDNGQSGIAHKSCMPNLLSDVKHRYREPIGKLLCRSENSSHHPAPSNVSINSDLTSQASSHASTPVPLVRIVSDAKGSQGTFIGDAKEKSDIRQQIQLQESHFATANGPQSIYTYEYDSGSPCDVSYRKFSDDPEAVLNVREYNFPMTVFGGTNDVIIMVEVSILAVRDRAVISF